MTVARVPAYGPYMDKFSALQILNLDGTASRSDAKKAFREMAKRCHPDRFAGRPGAAAAEEQMKRLNQAFALLMQILPEKEDNSGEESVRPKTPSGSPPEREGLFSAFRKRVGGLKKRGAKKKRAAGSRPGRAEVRASGSGTSGRPGPAPGPRPQSCVRESSFDHALSSACASPEAYASPSRRFRAPAGDAYSRYVKLKHHMQVQRRRPRQSAVSRVEKISPVQPVQKVADR